jgi:tetratricopeptide (TPR) repeat protein
LDAARFILPLADVRQSDTSFKSLTASTIPVLPLRSKEAASHKVGTDVDTRVKVSLHRDYEPIPRYSETQNGSPSLHELLQFDSSAQIRLSLANMTAQDKTTQPYCLDQVAELEHMLQDLETRQSTHTLTSELVDLAVDRLQSLSLSRSTTPRLTNLIKSSGLRLLRITIEYESIKTAPVLASLLPKFKDPIQVLSPVTKWLWEKKDKKGLEQLLEFLSDRKQKRFWMHGMIVYRVLSSLDETMESFKDIKHLYRLLQSAGLYHGIVVPPNIEYKIRRLMVSKALKAGDDAFAQEEMKYLCKVDPDAAKSDIKLQSRLIVREAALGHWESVRDGIEALESVDSTKPNDLRYMISKITDVFMQTCSSEGLETLLRRFVRNYNIPLKSRWVNLVLDRYASRHDLDSMFSWLQFCSEAGFQMDDTFMHRFYSGCRKYWSFSDKTITSLHQNLQVLAPGVSTFLPKKADGKGLSDMPPASLESRSWLSETDAFECMGWFSARNEWGRVCEAYSRLLLSELNPSVRCLRLAVIGHLKRQDGSINEAASLIDEARGRGQDVTEALTPLLLTRLEKEDDAGDLIKQALRRGARIHDSVYNKAAQILSAKGDLQGAATMCEVAARENGNGELLYNEYNFSNLVFAYTGSANYKALQSILSKFTSEVQWWRGSRACKESIKLAMKTAAMRAVVHPLEKNDHREALFKLDEALIHVKTCRSTRDDRRAVTEAFIRVIRPLAAEPEQNSVDILNAATETLLLEPTGTKHFQRSILTARQGLAATGEA